MRIKKYRTDRRRVKAWMIMQGIRICDIKSALGYKSHTGITATLTGARDSRLVLGWLRDQGCPVAYLKLPEDMMEKK